MKQTLILLFLFCYKMSLCQSEVEFFCSGRTYHVTLEKSKDSKSVVKLIGYNVQQILIDSSKILWDKLLQVRRDSIAVAKLKEKGIAISAKAIIQNTKYDDSTKAATVEFFDTLSYVGLSDVRTTIFADELTESFKRRFNSEGCKSDFNSLLEKLELKGIAVNSKSQTSSNSVVDVLENSFGVGVGLGPNVNVKKIYEYYVSPYDTTLHRDKLSTTSFVASLLLTWNPLYSYRKFQEGDSTIATGELFRAPGKWGIAVGFNFVEVNPSNMQFNFKLSGGIGVLRYLESNFQLGLFLDLTQQRVLRRDLETYIGKKYPFADISNLDSRLFTNQFIPSLSFKCIFKFKASVSQGQLVKKSD